MYYSADLIARLDLHVWQNFFFINATIFTSYHVIGDLAQMVERSLSMREALGSMPRFSIFFLDPFGIPDNVCGLWTY